MFVVICKWCSIKFRSEGQVICKCCKRKMFKPGKRKIAWNKELRP